MATIVRKDTYGVTFLDDTKPAGNQVIGHVSSFATAKPQYKGGSYPDLVEFKDADDEQSYSVKLDGTLLVQDAGAGSPSLWGGTTEEFVNKMNEEYLDNFVNSAGGGGGGDATAANQVIQINEAVSTNSKLDDVNTELDTQTTQLLSIDDRLTNKSDTTALSFFIDFLDPEVPPVPLTYPITLDEFTLQYGAIVENIILPAPVAIGSAVQFMNIFNSNIQGIKLGEKDLSNNEVWLLDGTQAASSLSVFTISLASSGIAIYTPLTKTANRTIQPTPISNLDIIEQSLDSKNITPAFLRTTSSGTIENAIQASFFNAGGNDAILLGSTLAAGESVTFNPIGEQNTYGPMYYDATGTTLAISYATINENAS